MSARLLSLILDGRVIVVGSSGFAGGAPTSAEALGALGSGLAAPPKSG